ncbi:MAG: YjgN family protein [Chitinophagales bacterium]|nr:YjgN family protein [Chitinophagales bacterium]
MELPKQYQLRFLGQGGELFSIQIVNLLLMIVTLGLYYPWAKAKTLRYTYGATEFEGSTLQFHGTGEEMFKGFIKAILFIIGIYAIPAIILFFMDFTGAAEVSTLFLYLGIIGIMPLAIHGSYRYRMSRTSWRGIRFGYRGNRGELVKLFFKGLFFTIITFGIYGAWFTVNLRNYVLSHIRFGSAEFKWKGDGGSFFGLNLGGYFLTIFTLGIYFFWWQKNLFEFYINNLWIEKDGTNIRFRSKATGGGFAGMMLVNILIIIFTFGLGAPWVVVRTLNFVFENIEIAGDVDLEQIVQTEQDFKDATGEDIADLFDFEFVI